MRIEPATAADVPQICELWNTLIRDTATTFTTQEKTPDDLLAMIAAGRAADQAFLVARNNGRFVGFALCFAFRGGPGYAHTLEHSVHLCPDARGAGIGRALMTALEEAQLRAGTRHLIAGVSGENPGGVAFHKAIGFAEVGRLPEAGYKFGRWMDLVLLQKTLSMKPDIRG